MAYYAALASAMELLHDILHLNPFPNSFLASSQTLKSLHQNFIHLLDSLQDYSSKGDKAADDVETRIRDAAYQALDIIESEISKQRPEFEKSLSLQLRWVECEEELQKVGQEVHSIVQEVNAIKESLAREDLQLDYEATGTGASDHVSTTGDTMVGFKEYLNAIKHQLCGSSSQLQVIPIVGMGGIGKTTLARNTFEDALIVTKFNFRGWITISQDYDVITILENIVKSLGISVPDELSGGEEEGEGDDEVEEEEGEPENETPKEKEERKRREIERKREKRKKEIEMRRTKKERGLKEHIHKHLTGRKFLMVIDDVWNMEICDYIKQIFPNEHTESRILLTTRLAEVAECAATSDFLHQMQFLSVDASWTLLQEKAFAQERCPQELVDIGMFIASKCQGLPLAIVLIGGILSNDKTLRHWKNVAADVGSVLSENDKQLYKILSLSYNHLPHQLKPCFLHMGSFPEDYEIDISKLMKLWIAEGFLKSTCQSKSLEKVGEEYLEDLVKRSLVIITKRSVNDQFKSCVIHDLLRDFCRLRGIRDYFFQVADRKGCFHPSGVEKVRRIVIDSDTLYMPRGYENGKYVRSFCWFSKKASLNVHSLDWSSIKLLRILDVADVETYIAPYAVSKMFHLKYLALRLVSKRKKHLPGSISKFQNLETLIIYAPNCRCISLPSEIWKMTRLRHLIIDAVILPPVNNLSSKLEHLQTLETVENFIFTDEAIQMIPNIKKLKLSCRGGKANDIWNLYYLNNLVKMLQLEKLNFSFETIDATQFSYIDSFWSSFVFPHNLKKLSLEGCRLPWQALTLVGSLKFLEVLRLRKNALLGDQWETVDGEFLELRFLLLESLNLKRWTTVKEHFPKLKHLRIDNCFELEDIPSDIGDIDTLKFITVYGSKLAGDSAKKILEEQHELENYELQVIVRD